jgi:hypothetical protein
VSTLKVDAVEDCLNAVCAANMKVITSIYLNCRPDLRDEWLTGTEIDGVPDAQVGTVGPCGRPKD